MGNACEFKPSFLAFRFYNPRGRHCCCCCCCCCCWWWWWWWWWCCCCCCCCCSPAQRRRGHLVHIQLYIDKCFPHGEKMASLTVFHYPAIWADLRRLRRIYLHFWRVDAVWSARSLTWLKNSPPLNYAARYNILMQPCCSFGYKHTHTHTHTHTHPPPRTHTPTHAARTHARTHAYIQDDTSELTHCAPEQGVAFIR